MKNTITYFAWFCVLFCTVSASCARADVCVMENGEDERRTRNAYLLAGLSILAIGGGIAALASASGHHKHHVSSSSSSCSPYRYSSSCSSSSSSHHHHHSSSHHHRHHHHHSSSLLSSWSSSSSSLPYSTQGLDPMFAVQPQEEVKVSGLFVAQPCSVENSYASISPFVQMPDGSTRSLGSIPLAGGSLSFGPFDQKGSYTLGVSLDQSLDVSSQTKIASVEVQVDGLGVQKHDFYVPPQASANYEPSPCYFRVQ